MGSPQEHPRRIDAYEVVRPVEIGSHATVYRVRHVVLGTDHALKIAAKRVSEAIADATLLGAKLQARVLHANVVRVTDAGMLDGRPWFVMDWAPGVTLAEWIDTGKVTDAQRAVHIFKRVARGLRAIHDEGVVHRDLKPDNVLMVQRGRRVIPRITDLALAKQVAKGEAPKPSGLSAEYSTLGTPGYMAPEQFENVGHVDHRADLFSLGVILYELLVGALPFDDDEEMMIFAKASRGDFTPVHVIKPGVAPWLSHLCDALLQVQPEDRPPDCNAVLHALQ